MKLCALSSLQMGPLSPQDIGKLAQDIREENEVIEGNMRLKNMQEHLCWCYCKLGTYILTKLAANFK